MSRIAMQLVASREYPVIDCQTMAEFMGHERLFRMADGSFLLHLSSEGRDEERIVRLGSRDTIIWLNEEPDQFGSYWEYADVASGSNSPRLTVGPVVDPVAVTFSYDGLAGSAALGGPRPANACVAHAGPSHGMISSSMQWMIEARWVSVGLAPPPQTMVTPLAGSGSVSSIALPK